MAEDFLRVGERFLDRYDITEILGAGGMSRVYGAVQTGLDRQVAIKLLSPVGADNLTEGQFENIRARFEREAKLISRFRSSHTVVMYDYGVTADHLYMILEYVDGVNLHELVEQTGPLPAERVARILRQALSSLAEAHEMGILHRDIKPQNIMVYEHLGDPDNTKVLDFGIAKAMGETGKDSRKLTEERTIVGTPSYMSPEQILGNKLNSASDIYSLGLVAYELLFGIVAVEADSAVSTMARHLTPSPIEIPDDRMMPAAFLEILRKMIAKDANERYQSAADVLADLNAWDGGDHSLTLPRITTPNSRVPTLDHAPTPIATTQHGGNAPLVVTGGLLTLAILVAVGVVVSLVWMMGSRGSEETAVDEAAVTGVQTQTSPTVEAEPAVQPTAEVAEALPVAEVRPVVEAALVDAVAEATPEVAEAEGDKKSPEPAVAPKEERKVRKVTTEPAAPSESPQPPEPLELVPPEQDQPEQEVAPPVVEPKPFTPKPPPTVAAVDKKKEEEAKAKAKKEREAKEAKEAAAKAAAEKEPPKKKAPPLSF